MAEQSRRVIESVIRQRAQARNSRENNQQGGSSSSGASGGAGSNNDQPSTSSGVRVAIQGRMAEQSRLAIENQVRKLQATDSNQ